MRIGLCALLVLAHAVFAEAQAVSVEVERKKGNVYQFQLQFVAQAPSPDVFALLTDYDQLTRLNPLILSSRVLPNNIANIDRVEIITRGCMWIFCKTIRRVEDVRVVNNLRIESDIIPSLSDFKSGDTLWILIPNGQQTIVRYQAKLVPDFWLPPFIGPRSLKKQLRVQLARTARRVNQLLNEKNE